MIKRSHLIYLAGPYSHKDRSIMEDRELKHAQCAVALKKQGLSIYAPIPETTALAKLAGLTGTSWEDWREHDLNLLGRCDEIMVMLIPGWKESLGVRGEVKFALKNNIPITFVSEDGSDKIRTNVLEMFEVGHVDELND